NKTREKTSVFRGFADSFASVRTEGMGPTGLRTKPGKRGKNHGLSVAASGGGANVVHSAPGGAAWAEVRALIERCPELPPEVRQQMIALGEAAATGCPKQAVK
ncbi:MAG: hypothetical protein ACK6EB_45990, partial [Planctomyces sp.]